MEKNVTVRSVARAVTMGVLETVTQALPASRQVELREKTRVTVPLDYPGIIMRAETLAEVNRARACAKEPETVAWLERTFKPGDVLYDIGANVGAYSLVAAAVAQGDCLVFAFEPHAATYLALVENVRLNNRVDCVTTLPVGLSDRTHVSILSGSADAGASCLDWSGVSSEYGRQHAMCFKLRDVVSTFALPSPTHIKLDVDGMEDAVIRGAAGMLEKPRLRTILIEAEEDSDAPAAIADAGFKVTGTYPRGGRLINWIFER